MTETWLPIIGIPGYEISDQGRVRSTGRTARILRPAANRKTGHLHVIMAQPPKTRRIHRLVLEAFLGPCPPGMEGRHLDGCPTHNEFSNLVWDTRGNNNRDKKWHAGSKDRRLNPVEVQVIKDKLAQNHRGLVSALAREYQVSRTAICAIKQGRAHTDV